MASASDPVAVRVMVFNIEDGGTGVDFDKVVEAIRLAGPDIVLLQEAMGGAARVADALGWGFASNRTQVVSRFPILEPPGATVPYQYVEVRPGGVLAVASVHLPAEPYGPELARDGGSPADIVALERRIRLPRLERTVAPLPALAATGVPLVVAGDFNAPSHLDWTAAAVGTRPHVRTAVPWPVSRAMAAAGFRDAWRERHPDPVAEPGLTWWADRPPTGGYEPGPDTPNDRIDAIFSSGPVVTEDCRIVGEAAGPEVSIAVDPWPSDHRAVVADFRCSPAPAPPRDATRVADVETARRPPVGPSSLETTHPVYRVGEPIEVRWTGGPGYRWDWIAVFPAGVGDPRDAFLAWTHTGARADGAVRIDAGSVVVDQSSAGGRWPQPPGDYEVSYLLDDATERLATVSFSIRP